MTDLLMLFVVMIAAFIIGYILISKVPALLHTPLMSMTNAISAVTILGGLIIFSEDITAMEMAVGAVALVMASFNIVGGFVITHRMVSFFKTKD